MARRGRPPHGGLSPWLMGAALAASLGGCGSGAESWILTFDSWHLTNCVDEFDYGDVYYDQESQSNIRADLYRGPLGILTVGLEPPLVGLRERDAFEVRWDSTNASATETSAEELYHFIVMDGTFDGDQVEGLMTEGRVLTLTADTDGDGIADTTELSCTQQSKYTGWRLKEDPQ